jgi:predicted dinucleotide-binding enzyme
VEYNANMPVVKYLNICNVKFNKKTFRIMKKKILVLGATGLVGKEVAKQLNVGGYNVVVMSRSREKAKEIFSEDFEIIEADLQNEELIKHSFTGINGVFISLPEQTVPEVINNIVNIMQTIKCTTNSIYFRVYCSRRKCMAPDDKRAF